MLTPTPVTLDAYRSESGGDDSGLWFTLAADTRLTNRSKSIIEYADSMEVIGDDGDDLGAQPRRIGVQRQRGVWPPHGASHPHFSPQGLTSKILRCAVDLQ